MQIHICDNYESLSKQTLDATVQYLQKATNPLLCVASGDSPKGLYAELVKRKQAQRLDISKWNFVGLDEWLGMDKFDEGSCGHMLDASLIQPLQLTDDNSAFFNGKATSTDEECARIESFIQLHGGIVVAILGLGLNGHLGLNEPGTSILERSHVSVIHPLTQQIGQKYFSGETQLSHGITLGLATLNEANQIMLVVNGERKAAIVQALVEGPITDQLPASLLRNHPGFHLFLDKAAASLLSSV